MTCIFVTQCKYYKKSIICGKISLVIALWADIFVAYIALNPISTFLLQFCQVDLTNLQVVPSSSLFSSFDDTATLLHYHDGPGCCSSCHNCACRYLLSSSSTPLPSTPSQAFSVLFCFNLL